MELAVVIMKGIVELAIVLLAIYMYGESRYKKGKVDAYKRFKQKEAESKKYNIVVD